MLWILLGVVSGACIAVQAPINARLGATLGLPFAAAFVSFAAGAVVLAIVTFGVAAATQTSIQWSAPAPWLFVVGGVLGTVYVTSAVVLTPQIGAAAVMALAVTGQLLAGIVIDRIGFLGLPVREISAGRIGGAVLLVAGALMIRLL
ncbi:MAG TPA: DMT family transporter [Devosia sp.]|nr:DMT family transporter [Devosia sp.]